MGKGASKLSTDDLKELESSTYFDLAELEEWYKEFDKECPTGKLTKEDFQKIYQQFFPGGDTSKLASMVFSVFDKDKDGTISFPEFISAISITSRGSLEEKLDCMRGAFSLHDVDGDGYITKKEMIEIVDAIHSKVGNAQEDETPKERVDKIFQEIDENNDGKLTKEEFKAGFKNDPWIVQALTMDT